MRKRLTAALLCFCLLFTLLPATAFAEGAPDSGPPPAGSALCEHHPSHDAACGYTEGSAGSPCAHEHTEDCYKLMTSCVHEHGPECYSAESVSENTATPSQPEEADPTACTHVCSEESGCITKTLACNHTHDEACGYAPATEGSPCTYVCEICNAQDSGNPATPSDAQPEECTCETLCTEEEVNADCPVCSAEGAELDKVCVGVAPMLPVTALAADNDKPNNLYVGNQNVKSGDDTTYWATTDSGELELVEGASDTSNNWNVKYDPNSATLTLKNATIEGGYDDVNTSGAGIYAASSSGPVSLNIVLEEENKVSGWNGINVSSGGDASLNISGSGSLTVSGLSGNGIGIFMSSQNSANLTIEEASVTALGSQDGGSGVRLITSQTGSPSLTIEVKGGSLQASGETNGIHFLSNVNDATVVANLKVSGNAMVKASSITTTKDGTGSAPELKPAASGSDGTGGIIWDGKSGTVYGDVTLQENLTIESGQTLTIPNGASLTIGSGATLTVDGGTLTGNVTGDVIYKVTGVSLSSDTLTLKVGESHTLTATITPDNATDQNVTWSSDTSGIVTITPDTSDSKKATITATGTGTTTIKATVDGKSVTCSVTVNAAANVPVTSVSLNKDSLTLGVGGEETLTASITPGNATNQNVTWSSDDTSVATVDATGKVNAMGAGTATITVTTADGGKIATCTVTVNPVQYTVTVQTDGNGTASASPATATAGTTVTLTADPDSGYHFERWEIVSGGVTISGNQFTMPAGNVTVKAVFVRNSSGFVPTRPWKPSRPVEPEEPEEPETPVLNGWVQEDGVWYLYKDGSMATGWNLYNGTWYYLHDWGGMATGWINLGGAWYYLYDWGGMATGWLNLNGTWYYLHDWGGMATGWLNLNGTWYYLKDWGGMATGWLNLNGTWYYLKDWGGMAVGWLNLNGTWYYLKDWGGMASNTTVDGYYLDVSGAWVA